MIKRLSQQASQFRSLAHWFERQKRVLPWRDEPSLYRVWISEVMLQQTQVVTVIPYFERWMDRFPTVETLAQASEQEVLKLWAGLGYYSRARNIHRTAKEVKTTSAFPKTSEGWIELPGIGPYTSGAIVSIALNQPMPILDGNVERVLSRIGCVTGDPLSRKKRLWKVARAWVSEAFKMGIKPSVFNQALMELGATVCTPRAPDCGRCPVEKICEARAKDEVEKYPMKKKCAQWKDVKEKTVCWIGPKRSVWLVQSQNWRAGLWDLPFIGLKDTKAEKLGTVISRHIVTHHRIERRTTVYRVRSRGKLGAGRWVSFEAIQSGALPMGSAAKQTLSKILEQFPGALQEC